MSDVPTRRLILETVGRIWDRFPEFRFGQLVDVLADRTEQKTCIVEDDEFLSAAMDMLQNARRAGTPSNDSAQNPV
jgi:hypothetical protein